MDTKATTLLAKLFGNDGRTIPYRPEVARVVGGIGAAILLQQIVYRANGSNFEAFYKFKEPCGHHLYREGDSWTEELGFNRREFDNALQSIAVKHTAKVTMESALETAQVQHKPVLYWTNASRVTFYRVEIQILVDVLSQAYDQKRKSDFSKSAKPTLDQKAESDFIRSETSTRLPEEKDPALPDSPPRFDELPIPRESGANDSITEETPTLYLEKADDPPADAIVWSEPSQHKTTAAEFKGRHAHTIDGLVREVERKREVAAHPDMTVATKDGDPWEDRPVKEWCAFIQLPYSDQSAGRKKMLANDLRDIATTNGLSKSPDETGEAIRKMTQSQSCEWMRSAGRPTHREFAAVLANVLCGQVLPEGKRNRGNGASAVEARAEYLITEDNPNPLGIVWPSDEEEAENVTSRIA